MNNADKHIDHWSNTDVQRYLKGELSAREMHDLEQLALDDPFLADALEGLQTQPSQTLKHDLGDLRTRLDTRTTARPAVIPWRAISAAAAVILLVGLGFTAFYTFLGKKQPESIAKTAAANQWAPPPPAANHSAAPPAANQPAAPPAATTPAPPAATIPAPPATANAAPPAADKARSMPKAKTTQPTIAEARRPAQPPPAAVAAREPMENPVHNDSVYSDNLAKDSSEFLPNSSVDERRSAPALSATVIRGANPHLVAFSGRVLDFNNHPLAGASLTYKSKDIVTGAVTDASGQFNLYVPQKDTTRQLTVAMAGYQETQYALSVNEHAGNTIYLRQNQPELNEVVVSGIGAKRKEFMAEPPSDNPEKLDSFWLNTAPAKGRIAYLDYLASARKTLPVDTTIHGIESISFRVDKKGALTGFRIERSLSPAHDAGVIRLITEGPPWKMLRGRSARALVNVIF